MNAGRSVLITGAASGIGLAIARGFAKQGDRLILVDRSPSVHDVAAELGTQETPAKSFVVDLADEAQILEMLVQVKKDYGGGCDVLVNNAAISHKKNGWAFPLPEITTQAWESVLRVNLTAPFILCRELLPHMQEKGWGRVVNISSQTARGAPTMEGAGPRVGPDYSASKAGLLGLTRRLAGEFARYGITINSVAPGRIDTPLANTSSSEAIAGQLAAIPMKRSGRVDEIAAAVLFLASEGASFVTGVCLDANGGAVMI